MILHGIVVGFELKILFQIEIENLLRKVVDTMYKISKLSFVFVNSFYVCPGNACVLLQILFGIVLRKVQTNF